MFYLTTHSTHFIYGYMASDIWLRTILIVKKETRCHHIGYSYRLTARVLLYAPSHIQDSTYHGLCYTSRGALAGTRNSSMALNSKRRFFRCNIREKIVHTEVFKHTRGATCSSVVRAFAHGAMGHRIDSSWGGPIELFLVPASDPRLV